MNKMTAFPPTRNTSGTTGAYIRIVPSSGTLRAFTRGIVIRNSIAVPESIVAAEVEAIIEEDYIRAYHAVVPERTIEEEEAEEREWHTILNQPRVQEGLLRLAEGIRRQIALGETEEGGFAIE